MRTIRRADSGAGEHRHRQVRRDHRHVNGDPVTATDAETFLPRALAQLLDFSRAGRHIVMARLSPGSPSQ